MFFSKPAGLVAIGMLALMLIGKTAATETGKLNIHLEPGAAFPVTGWQADELGVGMSLGAKLELSIFKWFGIQAGGSYVQFFKGSHPAGYKNIDTAYSYNGFLGVRFRLINDEKGYLWPWTETPKHAGNIWGNLWLDLHADYYYTGDLNRFGADTGLGYEFSLVNGLQIGPFVRGLYIYQPDKQNERSSADGWILVGGLSISAAIPPGGKLLVDTDDDGVFDGQDRCINDPEDHDGYQDKDGCPDNDNDNDTILDVDDVCPLTPEDMDGSEDQDGCPDYDNDGDNIPDSRDACPNEAEDQDKYEDQDGCPDNDDDGDGIADEMDQCPLEAETINKLDDDDGCPEPDKDGDGFVDQLDDCIDEPETVNGVEDDDGCPDKGLVEVQEDRIRLGQRVFFDRDMSRIKTRSRELLKHLANLINTHPEYIVISIEGHADRKGDKDYNLKLSQKRAGRVRDYLIRLGVKPDRLIIQGHGETDPWIKARTEKETIKNRRVELLIEKIDEDLAVTPISNNTKKAMIKTQRAKSIKDFGDRLDGKVTEESPETEKGASPSEPEKNAEKAPKKNAQKQIEETPYD